MNPIIYKDDVPMAAPPRLLRPRVGFRKASLQLLAWIGLAGIGYFAAGKTGQGIAWLLVWIPSLVLAALAAALVGHITGNPHSAALFPAYYILIPLWSMVHLAGEEPRA